MKNRYIIVTGGGTGGHLSVAKALIDELYPTDYSVIYIGSTKGSDKKWFEEYEKIHHTYFLNTRGVVNQSLIGKFSSLYQIIKQALYCRKIIKQYNVQKIISVGGFSAAPASFGAILSFKELYIHEQNSVMGNLNKITAKFAKEIFSSYHNTSSIKDYPINPDFFVYQRIRTKIKTIIFLGGSQGAVAINNFAIKLAPELHRQNIAIIHQCGPYDYERVKEEYEKMQIKVELFDFSTELITFMRQADFAISRSGASTLWELTALGLPSLFIPYPYAAGNHQYYNAKFLKDKDLALIENQSDLENFDINNIFKLDIKNMSQSLIDTIEKDGAKKIISQILN